MTEEAKRPESVRILPSGGAWLRIILTIACVSVMVNLYIHGQQGGQVFLQWAVAVFLTLWIVMRPASSAPVVLLVLAVIIRLSVAQPVLDGRLVALVLLLPLVHQLCALAAVIPLRSAVQWPALLPSCARYVGAVLVTVVGLLISHALGWW